MNKKKFYRDFCKTEKSINLFSKPDWLDVVVGSDNWDVSVVFDKYGNLVASMPYYIKKFFFYKIINIPQFTPKLGPWIKNYKLNSLSKNHRYMQSLIDQLPNFSYFYQNWDYDIDMWLPFYWSGYHQQVSYSFIFDDLTNLTNIYNTFSSACKRQIKKAKRNKIKVVETDDLKRFLILQDKTFHRQNRYNPVSDDNFYKLDKYLKKVQKRKIFISQDHLGNDHAGIYLVWDKKSAYYLAGGGDPKFRNSGAGNLCMWHSIQFSSTVSEKFDFEGSMIKNINNFFSNFGGVQRQYFTIWKSNSIIISFLLYIKMKLKSKFIINKS